MRILFPVIFITWKFILLFHSELVTRKFYLELVTQKFYYFYFSRLVTRLFNFDLLFRVSNSKILTLKILICLFNSS